jgi:hypothetical protein
LAWVLNEKQPFTYAKPRGYASLDIQILELSA